MHLTDRTDYGLRLLVFLAVHPERVSVATVARAFRVSEAHLAKVAQGLARAGFLATVPGRSGGMTLARPPEAIRVGDVVRALEPIAVVECLAPDNTCPIAGVCGLQPVLGAATEAFLAVLDGVTIADVTRQREGLRDRLGVSDPAG